MPEAVNIDIQRDQQGYLGIKAGMDTEGIYEYKHIRTHGISSEESIPWIVLTRQDTSYQPYMSIDQPVRDNDLTYINELLQSQSFNEVESQRATTDARIIINIKEKVILMIIKCTMYLMMVPSV